MAPVTQAQAARYAEIQLLSGRTLSRFLVGALDLERGAFSWTMPPVVDDAGEWYSPKSAPSSGLWGVAAMTHLVGPLMAEEKIVVVEDPIVSEERPPWEPRVSHIPATRIYYKPAPAGLETWLVVDARGTDDSIGFVHGVVGGAHRVIGIVTEYSGDLPPQATEIADDLLEQWARGVTHLFFRGPSYDGYVLWTASG